jgi:hypothetical protein
MTIQKSIRVLAVVIALILISLLIFLFEPIFLRRSFIDSVGVNMGLDIPQTARIVEYRFCINDFGAEPFLVKLELSQEEHDVLRSSFFSDVEMFRFNSIRQRLNYESPSIPDAIDIGWQYRMSSKINILGAWGYKSV